jgi:hypothetical protein
LKAAADGPDEARHFPRDGRVLLSDTRAERVAVPHQAVYQKQYGKYNAEVKPQKDAQPARQTHP